MRYGDFMINRRAMRDVALCIIAVLAAVPTFASDRLPTVLSTLGVAKAKTAHLAYQSLPADQRFFYPLNGLDVGTLEARWMVNGKLHLTEVIDLNDVTLPEKRSCADGEALNSDFRSPAKGLLRNDDRTLSQLPRRLPREATSAPQVRGDFLQKGRMIELLAKNPFDVRELHRLAGEGASISVEISHSGRQIESLPFAELVRRSADTRAALLVPVVVVSDVRGPGLVKRAFAIRKLDYLESCNDCTDTTPCDTECGYDPGKGGPETCGEYGAPCAPVCYASTNIGIIYGPWVPLGCGPDGYGDCFVTEIDNRWHDEYVCIYRRDVIQQTKVCPNAPSCDGCYVTESLIGYEYLYTFCYYRTAAYCYPGYVPYCDMLCFIDGFTICQ